MSALKKLALTALVLAYALIVLGSIVRITGAGMGCGDEWPLCNGRLIPALNDPLAVLEWGHRLVAAVLAALVVAMAWAAYRARGEPGGSGPGGALRPAALAVGLLALQVILGAVTVWLELPPATVLLHLATAMALIAVLLITALRAGGGIVSASPPISRSGVLSAVALGAAVILFGGVTANLGAGPACQGFPLCSGQVWPTAGESGLPHLHWTHRLLAYALLLHMLGVSVRVRGADIPYRLRTSVWFAFAVTVSQVVVAAIMVLALLPAEWRALHTATGTLLWVALVYAGWLVTQYGRPAAEA